MDLLHLWALGGCKFDHGGHGSGIGKVSSGARCLEMEFYFEECRVAAARSIDSVAWDFSASILVGQLV